MSKRKIIAILIIELLILAAALGGVFCYRRKLSKNAENYSLIYNGQGTSSCTLEKGSYTLTFDYESSDDLKFDLLANGSKSKYIKANTVTLDKKLLSEIYQFTVTKKISDISIGFSNIPSYFSVSGITLYRDDNSVRLIFLYIFLTIIIFNTILLIVFSSKEKRYYEISVLFIAIFTSLPTFLNGVVNWGDFNFHALRIEAITAELRLHNFPARIDSLILGGYGYPVSIYYGDLLLYFPALLRLFGLPIFQAFKAFVFLVNLLMAIFSVFCFAKIFKSKYISVVLSLAYMTSAYRLMDVYYREAVGEYLPFIFYPIVALGFYRIYAEENNGFSKHMKNAFILGFGMTGILTSHILSTEMTVFALILLALIYFKKTFSKNTLITIAYAVLSCLLLGAFFIVPFLDSYSNNLTYIKAIQINSRAGDANLIQWDGTKIIEYFRFFKNPYKLKDPIMTMIRTPGALQMLALILAIFLWIRKSATKEIKILTVFSAFWLLLSSNIFPWDFLIKHTMLFRTLSQVQFPWRYTTQAVIFLTMLLGFELKQISENDSIKIGFKPVLYFCLGLSCFYMVYFTVYTQIYSNHAKVYDTYELDIDGILNGEYKRAYEYSKGVYYSAVPANYNGAYYKDGIDDFSIISRKGTDIDIYLKSAGGGSITFPVVNYSNYIVTDDNGKEYKITDGADCIISVAIPKGFDGNLHLRFVVPWYWNAALIVSFVSLIVLIIFFYYNNKHVLFYRRKS